MDDTTVTNSYGVDDNSYADRCERARAAVWAARRERSRLRAELGCAAACHEDVLLYAIELGAMTIVAAAEEGGVSRQTIHAMLNRSRARMPAEARAQLSRDGEGGTDGE